LRLDKVDLVTLAACDTGLGPVLRDEGVFGLARAFHLAGAHDVVMSLWDVNDTSTADLMTRMYREYRHDHVDVASALADAARGALHARRDAGLSVHPYYWAAFLVNGDQFR
jgi:CHAT domain-containing protein